MKCHSNPLPSFGMTLKKEACTTGKVYLSDKYGSALKTTTCGLSMLSDCSLGCPSILSINILRYPSVVSASTSSNPTCYQSHISSDPVSQCWPSLPSANLSITEALCLWRRMHGYFRASWHWSPFQIQLGLGLTSRFPLFCFHSLSRWLYRRRLTIH